MNNLRTVMIILFISLNCLLMAGCTTTEALPTATVELKPTNTSAPTETETAVSEPTITPLLPTETSESVPNSQPMQVVDIPPCDPESTGDKMTISEAINNLDSVLDSMNSFQFQTLYQFTQNGKYIPDQLALEINGMYSGLTPDADFWMTPISYEYERSHTTVTDLKIQDQTETIVTEDSTWVKLTNDSVWIEQANNQESIYDRRAHNLPEVLGPFYLLSSDFQEDSFFIGHSEKQTIDGETMTHRCWHTDLSLDETYLDYPKVDGPFFLIWHWDQLYTFLEEPEIHIWLNEDETELLNLAITGKQVGDMYFDWEEGVVEHDPPNDFVYWVELSEVNQPISILPPSSEQLVLTLPTQTEPQEKVLSQETIKFPIPDNAVLISDPLQEDYDPGDLSSLKPREFLGPGQSVTYSWMSDYVSPAWDEMPYGSRPVYASERTLPDLFSFYSDILQAQGWQLDSAEFKFGKPAYYLVFSKGNQSLPILLEEIVGEPARIWAFLPQDGSSPETKAMQLTQYQESGISWIWDNEIDQSDSVWVSGREGISVYDGTEWTTHLKNSSVYRLAIDPDRNVWASTEEGFKIYDGENWAAPEGAANINFEYGLEDFTFDQDGRLWVIVANDPHHVAVFDNGEWQFFPSGSFVDCNTGLIFADSQGRIWLGEDDEKNTVYYLDGNDWYQVIDDQTTPLEVQECENGAACTSSQKCTGYGVNNIVEDSKGGIWVGYRNGLKYFDGQSWNIFDTETGDFPFDYVDAMTIDQFDRIWVLSDSSAFHMLDETGSWQSFFPKPSDHISSTQKLIVDAQGNIWLTGGSIFKYEPPKP
ncbi:MAG: hypothetical protein R6X34_10965 [Chloroflexota bacterium]